MADAQQYSQTIAEELEDLEQGKTEDGPTVTAYEAVLDWAEACVLDLEWTTSSAGRSITEVTITRTVGGPGCYIHANGDGTVTVRTYWGTDRSEWTVDAPTVDMWAWEMAELSAQLAEVRA